MKTKTRRKFSIQRKESSVMALRNSVIWKEVSASLTAYLKGEKYGTCLVCVKSFEKRHRWHSCCSPECYAEWTKGTIRQVRID